MLRVRVFEAQITNVVFEGDAGKFGDSLAAIGARLEEARPLRSDDVPRALHEMRRIAGLAVTATSRRDATVRNAFELLVRAEFTPLEGVVRMNNRGTDQVALSQIRQGLIGVGKRIRRDLRLYLDLRGQPEEMLAVLAGQIRDRNDLALLPEQLIGEARDITHMYTAADKCAPLPEGTQSVGYQ